MDFQPVIAIAAFDRSRALHRLLESLERSKFVNPKPRLIISIEGGAPRDTIDTATGFARSSRIFDVKVIERKVRLGLKQHILTLGDLSTQYGSVLLLEDDLTVDPFAYEFAKACLNAYANEPSIAGHALYAPRLNEFARLPFEAMGNGYDTYMMQVPCSWGQAWSAAQWRRFRNWLDRKDRPDISLEVRLPESVRQWSDRSWKKHFAHYMVSEKLWFSYPYQSLATNHADQGGTHLPKQVNFFQVPLPCPDRPAPNWSLCPSSDDLVRYDAHMEACGSFVFNALARNENEVAIDIYGSKSLELLRQRPLVLTSKPALSAVQTFAISVRPAERALMYPSPAVKGSPMLRLIERGNLSGSRLSTTRDWLEYWMVPFVPSRRLLFAYLKQAISRGLGMASSRYDKPAKSKKGSAS